MCKTDMLSFVALSFNVAMLLAVLINSSHHVYNFYCSCSPAGVPESLWQRRLPFLGPSKWIPFIFIKCVNGTGHM